MRTKRTGKEIPNIHREVNSGYKVPRDRSSCLLYLDKHTLHSYTCTTTLRDSLKVSETKSNSKSDPASQREEEEDYRYLLKHIPLISATQCHSRRLAS